MYFNNDHKAKLGQIISKEVVKILADTNHPAHQDMLFLTEKVLEVNVGRCLSSMLVHEIEHSGVSMSCKHILSDYPQYKVSIGWMVIRMWCKEGKVYIPDSSPETYNEIRSWCEEKLTRKLYAANHNAYMKDIKTLYLEGAKQQRRTKWWLYE